MECVLSGAPVSVPRQFDRSNEHAFRQFAEGEFASFYRKDGHIILPFGFKLGFTGANGEEVLFVLNGSGEFTLTVNGVEILNITADAATFAINNDGRVTGIRLSDGTVGTIDMLAAALNFYDGVTDRPLLTAAGGLFTVNGDVAVTGSIRVGAVRWPVALQTKKFYVADGGTVQWASGAALSAIPEYQIILPTNVALASGEAWEAPTLTGATTVGATLRLKISTPGTTSSVTDTTDTAGGGGDPDRVMEKSDSADSYDGIYDFRATGTITITSENLGFGMYFHNGRFTASTWFDDGGGWVEGPGFVVDVIDVLGFDQSGSDLTGAQAFDITIPITWADVIGQHGTYEYGMSYEGGGSLTDFVSVQYTKQAVSGSRTGSPNGETATILVLPKNI